MYCFPVIQIINEGKKKRKEGRKREEERERREGRSGEG